MTAVCQIIVSYYISRVAISIYIYMRYVTSLLKYSFVNFNYVAFF